MRISVGAGTYVAAVSGGVDSMVLLDLLRQRPGIKVVVAHFDHGIRDDSAEDRKLVAHIAKSHRLPFVHGKGKLGPNTSEAVARQARYDFLHSVRRASQAKGIIMAHHQDDLIETAILNLLRGSGRRGLSSLKSTDGIFRPLLEYDKSQLRDYAQNHALRWREDSTNSDTKYLRNYVRHQILPKFSPGERAQLLILLERLAEINDELDHELTSLLHLQPAMDIMNRHWFIDLPHSVAGEVLHTWLRRHDVKNINRKTIERLIVAMKTGRPGTKLDVDGQHQCLIQRNSLVLRVQS